MEFFLFFLTCREKLFTEFSLTRHWLVKPSRFLTVFRNSNLAVVDFGFSVASAVLKSSISSPRKINKQLTSRYTRSFELRVAGEDGNLRRKVSATLNDVTGKLRLSSHNVNDVTDYRACFTFITWKIPQRNLRVE
jgi:hypothetical protein